MKAFGIPNDPGSRYRRQFRTITFFEGVGCGAAVAAVLAFHRLDMLAPSISLVVGAHFLPLGRLFRLRAYYLAGIAIMLFDLLSLSLFSGNTITFWAAVSTGVVLWTVAVYALVRSRECLFEATR